jgi:hypothetical protein
MRPKRGAAPRAPSAHQREGKRERKAWVPQGYGHAKRQLRYFLRRAKNLPVPTRKQRVAFDPPYTLRRRCKRRDEERPAGFRP